MQIHLWLVQFIDTTLKSLNLNQAINTVFKRIIHTKHVPITIKDVPTKGHFTRAES